MISDVAQDPAFIPAPALPPNPRCLLLHRLFTAAALDSLKRERRHANVKGVLGTRGARRCGLGSPQPSSPRWIPQKKGSVRQTGQESTRSRTKMQTHEKKDVPLDGAMPDGQVRRRRRNGQGPRTTRHSGSHPSLRDALHGVTATLVVTRPPFRGVVYYPNLESSPQLSPGDLARPRRLRED